MTDDDLTARCVRAAQLLKQTDEAFYLPVIRLLLAREQTERKKTRNPVRAEVTRDGRRVKGGKNKNEKIDWENPDILYVKEER